MRSLANGPEGPFVASEEDTSNLVLPHGFWSAEPSQPLDRLRANGWEAASLGALYHRLISNRSIETAQVIEELVEMTREFKEAANRGEQLGLGEDEVRFYDALANNESAVRELTDKTLKKIAHELTENLRKNISVDWSQRESVRASLRLMVKRILRKYKYPPDLADAAVELVLQQAEALGESWAV